MPPRLATPIALALAVMGGAAGPPPDLVAMVREATKDDVDAPKDPAKLFRKVEVSPDGVADWRVSYEDLMGWCGTGGCREQLFVSRPGGGYVLAYDAQARGEFRLKKTKAGRRLDVEVHGSVCGEAGVAECLRSFLWDDAEARFTEIPNRKGDGRLVGLMPVVEPDPASYPASVRAELGKLVAACAAAGGKAGDGEFAVIRTPDIDGDGRGDWLVTNDLLSCEAPAAPPAASAEAEEAAESGVPIETDLVTVLLAGVDPRPVLTGPIYAYVFDVSTRPATFIAIDANDDCGGYEQKACAETAYRWTGEGLAPR